MGPLIFTRAITEALSPTEWLDCCRDIVRGEWNRVDRDELSRELEIWRSGPITREEIIARLSEASPTFQRALEEEEIKKKKEEEVEVKKEGIVEGNSNDEAAVVIPAGAAASLGGSIAQAVAAEETEK